MRRCSLCLRDWLIDQRFSCDWYLRLRWEVTISKQPQSEVIESISCSDPFQSHCGTASLILDQLLICHKLSVRIHPSVAKQQHADQSDHLTGECQETVRNLHSVLHWGKVFCKTDCILCRPDSKECDQICGITFDPVTMRTDEKSIFIFKISSQSS